MFQSSVFLGAVQSGKEKTDYLHVSMTRNESGIPIRQAYKEKKRPKLDERERSSIHYHLHLKPHAVHHLLLTYPTTLNLLLLQVRRPGRRRLKVNAPNCLPLPRALPHQVPKVPPRDLALAPHTQRVLAARTELLDGPVEREAQVVGGDPQDLADGGGDARGVGVHVVHLGELRRDLFLEAAREGVRDLAEDVGSC